MLGNILYHPVALSIRFPIMKLDAIYTIAAGSDSDTVYPDFT
jgi:hypothetical protein